MWSSVLPRRVSRHKPLSLSNKGLHEDKRG
jgi:hypothetical protein